MYMDRCLGGQAMSAEDEVGRSALPFEFMLNALRLREGFEVSLFAERTGLPLSAIDAAVAAACARGLLERGGPLGAEWLRPSVRGFDFLSDLQEMFL